MERFASEWQASLWLLGCETVMGFGCGHSGPFSGCCSGSTSGVKGVFSVSLSSEIVETVGFRVQLQGGSGALGKSSTNHGETSLEKEAYSFQLREQLYLSMSSCL